jgi:hypothetical protein
VFKKRTKIFGLRRKKGKFERRKLHNGKFYKLYSSPNSIRVIRSRIKWAKRVACMRVERCMQNDSQPQGKRSFGRLSLTWQDHIKIHLREVGLKNMHCIYVDRRGTSLRALVNRVMNLPVP